MAHADPNRIRPIQEIRRAHDLLAGYLHSIPDADKNNPDAQEIVGTLRSSLSALSWVLGGGPGFADILQMVREQMEQQGTERNLADEN